MEKDGKLSGTAAPKKRKPYQKPSIQTERVLDAGMATCNVSTQGKKHNTPACTSNKLVC